MSILKPILKTGCYYIRYRPAVRDPDIDHFDGVLRVTREDAKGKLVGNHAAAAFIRASADLYAHHRNPFDYKAEELVFEHYKKLDPEAKMKELPFFPRSMYSHYLLASEVREHVPEARHVMIRFDVYKYDRTLCECKKGGTCLLVLKRGPDDGENPEPGDALPDDFKDKADGEFRDQDFHDFLGLGKECLLLRGDVYDEQASTPKGNLQIVFVSDNLREARVEIDCVSDKHHQKLPAPLDNPDDKTIDWEEAFYGSGWKVEAYYDSKSYIQMPPKAPGDPLGSPEGMWYLSEIHQVMLKWREVLNLDQARYWDYYLLCVQNIKDYDRGVSFDQGVDMDNVPDQVVALGADWKFPKDEDKWKDWRGHMLKETAGYFRTAVHEMGHAAGLGHNHADDCFMNTTDVIAENGQGENGKGKTAPKAPEFPENIKWRFHYSDQARLRHQPDAAVRPDMVYRGDQYLVQPDSAGSAKGIQLNVRAHVEAVPYGAPVRVEFELENTSDQDIYAPNNFSLKSGHVFGKVIDPQGRQFRVQPVATRLDEEAPQILPKKTKGSTRSLTLLRGPDGPLFRVPGIHQVHVGLYWFDPKEKTTRSVWGWVRVNITAAVDDFHRVAALKLLGAPEAFLNLAIGGDHLADGQKTIDAAVGDNLLRPHVGVIECKRYLRRFHHYKVNKVDESKKPGKRCRVRITFDHTRHVDALKAFEFFDRYTVCGIDEILSVADRMECVRRDKRLFKPKIVAEFTRVARQLNERIDYFLAYGRLEAKKDEKTIKSVRDLLKGLPPPPPDPALSDDHFDGGGSAGVSVRGSSNGGGKRRLGRGARTGKKEAKQSTPRQGAGAGTGKKNVKPRPPGQGAGTGKKKTD